MKQELIDKKLSIFFSALSHEVYSDIYSGFSLTDPDSYDEDDKEDLLYTIETTHDKISHLSVLMDKLSVIRGSFLGPNQPTVSFETLVKKIEAILPPYPSSVVLNFQNSHHHLRSKLVLPILHSIIVLFTHSPDGQVVQNQKLNIKFDGENKLTITATSLPSPDLIFPDDISSTENQNMNSKMLLESVFQKHLIETEILKKKLVTKENKSTLTITFLC